MKMQDIVETYCMVMNVCQATGLSFKDAIEMPEYELVTIYNEVLESRIPNHLGLNR